MKRVSLLILFLIGFSFNSSKVVAQTTICCLSASMDYCVVVSYPGTGGDGPSHYFRGIRVSCPQVP
jgi:hypothetical protein